MPDTSSSLPAAGLPAVRRWTWLAVMVAFLVPFAVSLAANFTKGVQSGSSVLVVAGIAIPTVLMIAGELYLWVLDRFGDVPLVVKVAMALPVVVAAGWSWLDTTSLLLAQYADQPGGPWFLQRILCVVAPLATDGLAVVAVYVRRLLAKTVREAAATPVPAAAEQAEPVDAGTAELEAEWGGPEQVDGQAEQPDEQPDEKAAEEEPEATVRHLPNRRAKPRPRRTRRAVPPPDDDPRSKRALEQRLKELGLKRTDANESKGSMSRRVRDEETRRGLSPAQAVPSSDPVGVSA